MKLTRQEVYELIDGERDYQDKRWPHDAPDVGSHDVGTYILFMKGYVNKAIETACFSARHEQCIEHFRKIAALAVRCMEGHGAMPRTVNIQSGVYQSGEIQDKLGLQRGDRSVIYKIIDGERDYQRSLLGPGGVRSCETQEVGSYLLLLQDYVDKAQVAWVAHHGDVAALDVIRKVAGIAVRCMEEHGAPPRVP
jgi:hypothetical protein